MFVVVEARASRAGASASEERAATLVQRLFPAASPCRHPPTSRGAEPQGLTIDAWLRLDNRSELATALGIDARAGAASDEELVLAAYRRWGPECVDRLEGDFAFVIRDPHTATVFAARDALGIRPLYYAITDELFAASPTAAVFDAIEGVDTTVRSEWLADFTHGMSGDDQTTPFAGVRRLPPGHWLHLRGDDVTLHRYATFDPSSVWEDTRDDRWLEAYRSELIRAVSVRTDPHGLIGVETSGGIDSSTVLGVMAATHQEAIDSIHTFGFATAELEPEYLLETSAAHGITHNHILTNYRGAQEPQRRGWQAIGYPTEHGNSTFHIPFYELAAQLGVTTLHSGHGGDEVVTNTGGLATQELLAHGAWRQAMRDLPGHPLMRPARLAKRMRRRPQQTSHLTGPMMARLRDTPLRAEVVADRRMAERTRQRSRYDAAFSRVNDFVLGDRLSAMTSIRTADCSLVAASYGVDYRWPLLDRRLIQQYLATPAVWKFGEGYGRYLHRRAITGMVPDKVAWKASKYMGDPRNAWLQPKAPTPRFDTSAEAFIEQLHPQVAELVDVARVRVLLSRIGGAGPEMQMKRRALTNLALLSEWLADRDR